MACSIDLLSNIIIIRFSATYMQSLMFSTIPFQPNFMETSISVKLFDSMQSKIFLFWSVEQEVWKKTREMRMADTI